MKMRLRGMNMKRAINQDCDKINLIFQFSSVQFSSVQFSSVQFSSYILITPLHTIYNQKNYKDIQQCAKEINTRIHYKNR